MRSRANCKSPARPRVICAASATRNEANTVRAPPHPPSQTDAALVTIGLPVYNGLPHLEVAVNSLLRQDYPNIELLISDNASTDGTGEYCGQLAEADPRVRIVRNECNIGPT